MRKLEFIMILLILIIIMGTSRSGQKRIRPYFGRTIWDIDNQCTIMRANETFKWRFDEQ